MYLTWIYIHIGLLQVHLPIKWCNLQGSMQNCLYRAKILFAELGTYISNSRVNDACFRHQENMFVHKKFCTEQCNKHYLSIHYFEIRFLLKVLFHILPVTLSDLKEFEFETKCVLIHTLCELCDAAHCLHM